MVARSVRDAYPRRRERAAQLGDLVLDARAQLLVVRRGHDLIDPLADTHHLGDSHAARRHRWGPETDPRWVERLPWVERHGVVVELDPGTVERLRSNLARHVLVREIDEQQVVVRPAGNELEVTSDEVVGERLRVGNDGPRVLLELRLRV